MSGLTLAAGFYFRIPAAITEPLTSRAVDNPAVEENANYDYVNAINVQVA